MSRTDPPDHRDHRVYDRDNKDDRIRWQRQFRRGVRQSSLEQQNPERTERRWRRTSGWLSH